MSWAFRVSVGPGTPPVVEVSEVSGDVPEGVFQLSGHDNSKVDTTPSSQVSVSVVQHDAAGNVVVGASGYRAAGPGPTGSVRQP